jgi:hypothetical protein
MRENGTRRQSPEYFSSSEAVHLLWEGTRKALDGGVDHDDLVSLCEIIVRLADDRLLFIQARSDSPSTEVQEVANLLLRYRTMASDLLQWATKPTSEPDWAVIAEKLESIAAAPLELES